MYTSPIISETRMVQTIESSIFFLSLPFFIMELLLQVYGKELGASALVIGVIFSAFSVMTSPRIILKTLNSFNGLVVLWLLLALCFAVGDPAEQALGGDWSYDAIDPSALFLTNGVILALCGLLLLFFLQIPRPIPEQETAI